jgi:short-subunit dehydrogenase
VLSLPTDVAQQDQVEAMVERALERFGRVDILVNNAGVGLVALVEETTAEDMEMVLRVNFLGAFYGIRAVLPVMRRQGSGHIINISSFVGKRGLPLSGAYCASKFALVGLSESLRLELRGSGIKASVICPVGTATEFFAAAKDPGGRKPSPKPPVQTPSHVARAIVRCARSPRPEVILYPPARILVVLNALSPTLADWVIDKVISGKA